MIKKFVAPLALIAAMSLAPAAFAQDEAAEATAEAAATEDHAAAVAALDGDAKKGRRAYNQCRSCHVIDKEQNRQGPHQVGLIGRPAGAVEGFKYSDALKESGLVWNVATLQEFLANPKEVVPGISAQMGSIRVRENRLADLITYLYEEGGVYEGDAAATN